MNPAIHQLEHLHDGDEDEPVAPKHRIPPGVYVGWAITVLSILALGAYSWGVAMTKLDQHSEDIKGLKFSVQHTDKTVNRIAGKLGIQDGGY